MSSNFHGYSLNATMISVGTSSVLKLDTLPGQCGLILQYVSGGTLWFSGTSLAIGSGCVFQGAKDLNLPDFRGPIYLSATGATVVLNVIKPITNA
jgi:hypothetical protein